MVGRMPALATEEIPTIDRSAYSAFFRQSGWLILATIVGGAMTLGVHPLNKHIADSEYTGFGVLLMVVSCLPTLPLQMIFEPPAVVGQLSRLPRTRALNGSMNNWHSDSFAEELMQALRCHGLKEGRPPNEH
jgi:hypothetical protein